MNTQCPYCGNAAKKIFSVHDINQKMSDQEFHYYRCNKCGLIYLDPIPSNIQDYYGRAYPAYQKVEQIRKEVTDYDLGKIATINQYAQGNKLLEIGPGNGTFAYLAKQEGFIVDVIEMDPDCCQYLKETIQVRNVINSNDIEQALRQTEGGYDVIVMWHVLEHLKTPWNILRALPQKLATNGLIIIAVPNPNALQFKLFKKFWKHVDAPRHVAFLPMKLLIKEMECLGLEKILVTTNDPVNSIFNVCNWWLSSLDSFIAGNRNSYMGRFLNRRSVAIRVYNYLIGWLERIEGNGNAFLAVFKKR